VRIGIGLLVPVAARAMSAVVETIRRKTAIEEGLEDEPDGVVNVSSVAFATNNPAWIG
jgi:peptide/histidine transporter 3/4